MKPTHTTFLYFLTLAVCLVLMIPGLPAQNRSGEAARGKVLNADDGSPLEYATVVLLSKDSAVVGGTVTDSLGRFRIAAPAGAYILRVDYLGYERVFYPGVLIKSGGPSELVTIELTSQNTTLDEVQITGQKSLMSFEVDKRVFNVAGDLSNIGGSVQDALQNIPSVTVDVEGNVSLRGSNNVRLLIDGKPSGLTGISSADALRQIPANLVDRIEVVTNPSARYDAEGTSGIINIILKKDKKQGWNGFVDLAAGYPHTYNGSLNLNRRTGKVNFFVSGGGRYRETPGFADTYRETYAQDTTAYLRQRQVFDRAGWSANLRMGMDWFVDKWNTLTVAGLYRYGEDGNNFDLVSDYLNNSQELQRTVIRSNNEDEVESNADATLSYRRTFPQKDRELTADLQYSQSYELELLDARENTFDPNGQQINGEPLLQETENLENQKNLLAQLDYVHPLGEDSKFEAGFRSNNRWINTRFIVDEYDRNSGEWEIIPSLSNRFNYQEGIHAGYAIYSNKIGPLSYQLGARLEYTLIDTELEDTGERNRRDYLNLFPSIHTNLELANQNNIQLSLTGRIDRPRFWWLNPFLSYTNPENIWAGNPNLDPTRTWSSEFAHTKYWNKISVVTSIYYRYSEDVTQRITSIDTSNVTLTRPENLDFGHNAGVELIVTGDITPWWNVTASGNFFYQYIDGGAFGENFNNETYSLTARLNSRITFWENAQFQVMVNYRGPENTAQGIRRAITFMDFGFSKEIMKKTATVSVRVSDVFNSRIFRSEARGDNFFFENNRQWRARQVIVGFAYRFGSTNERGRNMRRGGGNYGGGGGDEN